MLIGMCGAAGSGKDAAAKAIIDEYGYTKESFADSLKRVASFLFSWDMDSFEDSEWKEKPNSLSYGKSPREVLQTLGTDWGRNTIDENIWVDSLLRRVRANSRFTSDKFIFTDVRFPNEARAIRENGGILIYVSCIDRSTSTDHIGHPSEQWIPWLHLFADVEISAQFGAIAALREAAVSTVDNYLNDNVPRHEPNAETLAQLEHLATIIQGGPAAGLQLIQEFTDLRSGEEH